MAGWRDNLRQGSFKGINFFLRDDEKKVGRRLSIDEFPFRDDPYAEDMGRAARRYTLTIYLLGDNYMAQRDAMLTAIEAGGPGQLVHPYYGTATVIAEDGSARHSKDDGGYVEITINFVEAGVKKFPNSNPAAGRLASLGADNLTAVSSRLFVNGLTLQGISDFVRDSYTGSLSDIAGIFSDIQASGGINSQGSSSLVNEAAEWVASLAQLKNPSLSLVSNPSSVAGNIISLFKGLLDMGGTKKQAAENLQDFSDFTIERSTSTTEQSAILNSNAQATERFIRTVAISNESKAVVNQSFTSYDEAMATREEILSRIDALALDSQNDDEYDAIQNLRATVGSAVPKNGETLPRLASLTLPQSEPSLVVAYNLYNSISRESDIVARNRVRHPGFVPGGAALEVLSDA